MAEVDPNPASRSRLLRDLALRGAQAERHDRQRLEEALEYLRRIQDGEVDHDFAAVRAMHAERERGFD